MNIRAVIWDFDNTLVNQRDAFERTLRSACKNIDVVYSQEQVEEAQKTNLVFEGLFKRLFPELGEADRVLNEYRRIACQTEYQACAYGPETAALLQRRHVTQLVLTNRANLIEVRLKQAGYALEAFERIISPAEKKPKPESYDEVLHLLADKGIAKETVISLGDHTDDYYAANGAGIQFFAITTGSCSEADFIGAGVPKERIFTHLGLLLGSGVFGT